MADLLNRVLRVGEGRKLKELEHVARATNRLADEVEALDDDAIRSRFAALRDDVRARIADGADVEATLRDVEPEALRPGARGRVARACRCATSTSRSWAARASTAAGSPR